MGIASLIVGILAVLSSAAPFAGIVLGIVAIILGVIGRRKLLEEGRSAGVAIGGIIAGALGLIAGLGFTISCLMCGACFNAAAEQAEEQNQALAEQMAQSLQQSMDQGMQNMGNQGMPGTTPTTPTTPVDPGMPTPMPMPTPAMPSVGGGTVAVGMPAGGMFAPGLPTDPTGKPFIDYTLTIAAPGTYQIDLLSSNTMQYDPYIILLQGPMELGRDDDGGDASLQSRLTQMLQPGVYTVRVTKFGSSQVTTATPFTLMVAQVG